MSTQSLHKRLDSILQFMSPHWSWVNCHMVNYLTDNHWQTFVPLELQNEISSNQKIDECIENVFWNLSKKSENSTVRKFPEFTKFCNEARQHSLHAFEDIIITPEQFEDTIFGVKKSLKQQIRIKEFLTEKKQHEVTDKMYKSDFIHKYFSRLKLQQN